MASHAETTASVATQIRELHLRGNEQRRVLHNPLLTDVAEELVRLGATHSPPTQAASHALLALREQKATELQTLTLRVCGRSVGRHAVTQEAWAASSSRFDLPALMSTCDALSDLTFKLNEERGRAEQLALENEIMTEENGLFRAALTSRDTTVTLPLLSARPGQGAHHLLQPHALEAHQRSLTRPSTASGRTARDLSNTTEPQRVRRLEHVKDVDRELGRGEVGAAAHGDRADPLSESMGTPLMQNEVELLRESLAKSQRHVRLLEEELEAATQRCMVHG